MGVEGSIRKAFIYVHRANGEVHELLVFRSLEEPDGFEVPKGAAEPGETFADAARRELLEEAGLPVDGGAELGTTWYLNEEQRFFIFEAPHGIPSRFEHTVTGRDGDAGLVYQFQFLPIDAALDGRLVQGSGAFVGALRRHADACR